jgi:hypothetical protein
MLRPGEESVDFGTNCAIMGLSEMRVDLGLLLKLSVDLQFIGAGCSNDSWGRRWRNIKEERWRSKLTA